jgi:PAS domain S-box-containing protein
MSNAKGQILVVDDEVYVADAMARLLKKQGYEVLVAHNGIQALDIAMQKVPQLVLCDIVLPDIAGTQILTTLKSTPSTSSCFVVLMSAHKIDTKHQAEGFELGADGYLVKPIQNRELIARIDAFMKHKNTIDQLKESEDRFRKIVDRSTNALLIIDSNKTIQFANPNACSLYNKSSEELKGSMLQLNYLEQKPSEVIIETNGISHTFEVQTSEIVWSNEAMTLITLHDVTERTAYIKRIDEQNKRYARAQAMGKVGNWEFNYSNNKLWISDEAKRILGLSRSDFHSLEALSKKNILGEGVYKELIGFIERREDFSYIFDVASINQTAKKTLVTKAEFEQDPEGLSDKFVGVILDITERKMAEEAIRASELNFRTIFNSTNEAIFISDTNGIILDVNKRVLEIYGFKTKGEIVQKTLHFVNANEPPYTQEHAEFHIKQALSKDFHTFEWLAKKNNGEQFWIEVSLSRVNLNNEQRIISVVRDISSRKKTEKEFQRLNQEIAAIFKASKPLQYQKTPEKLAHEIIQVLEDILNYEHCSVLLVDADGVTLKPFAVSDCDLGYIYNTTEKTYIEGQELKIGKGIVGWVVENAQSLLINDATRDPRYVEFRHDTISEICVPIISDSTIIGAINIESKLPNAYTETDLKILETMSAQIGIAIQNANLYQQLQKELTERKHFEKRLSKLNEELEARVAERTQAMEEQLEKLHKSQKAMLYMVEDLNEMTEELKRERQKLEAINHELESFSYSVSHDLRAPLRAIDGFSKILEEDYAESIDDEGKRLLNVVRTNSQKMDQLIIDLLALSRVARGQLKLVDISMNSIISNVYKDIFEPINSGNVEINVKPLPPTKADPTLIKQVWQNLIGNAIKYSKPDVTITIEIGGSVKDDMCHYYIKDNGIGFDPKYATKIFETFQRLHRPNEFEGTGIGLSVVQRIVHRHGGTAWAESEVGQGATFWFTLPYISE